MSRLTVTPLIEKEEVYANDNKNQNTFKSVDELLTIGINRNTIYREESLRKKRNAYSHRRFICK